MKVNSFISSAFKTLLNASSKNTTHHDHHQLIHKVVRGACFSCQGIHHNSGAPIPRPDHQPLATGQSPTQDNNKIDAPFAGTEPKAQSPYDDDGDKTEDGRMSKTENTTDYVADTAKKGTTSALETVFDVGAAMAEGMEHTWGGVKQTTHKVKDAILGKGEDDKDGGENKGDDHKVDKHVGDLRRKAGGYDFGSN